MPKIVDHDERRAQVAQVAARLVAEEGVDALTTRNVAEAAGFSTAVVSHYFADKEDLLLATYRHASDHIRERQQAALQAPGRMRERVTRALEALLPVNADAREDWLVLLAFWGKAASSEALAAEQAARVHSAYARIAELLAEEPGLTKEQRMNAARSLVVTVQGISTYAAFDTADWSPKRQRQVLRDQIAAVLPSE